jgi:hypothetical protein
MASDADREGTPRASAHRIIWFGVERPTDGTVYVKPPAPDPADDSIAATDSTS